MVQRKAGKEAWKFLFYFGIIMGGVYVAVGILLIARGNKIPQLQALPVPIWLLGVVLIAYGLFRMARLRYRQRIDEDYE